MSHICILAGSSLLVHTGPLVSLVWPPLLGQKILFLWLKETVFTHWDYDMNLSGNLFLQVIQFNSFILLQQDGGHFMVMFLEVSSGWQTEVS